MSSVFIRQEVIRYNADSASVCYGNLNFVTVKVDADDIEGDERFAIVQFKFREIVRSELGEIGNFGFHRVLPPNFYFLPFSAVAKEQGTVKDIRSVRYSAEVNGGRKNCRVGKRKLKVLSGNFSAVYFREEPCYDSHNEGQKIRRKLEIDVVI